MADPHENNQYYTNPPSPTNAPNVPYGHPNGAYQPPPPNGPPNFGQSQQAPLPARPCQTCVVYGRVAQCDFDPHRPDRSCSPCYTSGVQCTVTVDRTVQAHPYRPASPQHHLGGSLPVANNSGRPYRERSRSPARREIHYHVNVDASTLGQLAGPNDRPNNRGRSHRGRSNNHGSHRSRLAQHNSNNFGVDSANRRRTICRLASEAVRSGDFETNEIQSLQGSERLFFKNKVWEFQNNPDPLKSNADESTTRGHAANTHTGDYSVPSRASNNRDSAPNAPNRNASSRVDKNDRYPASRSGADPIPAADEARYRAENEELRRKLKESEETVQRLNAQVNMQRQELQILHAAARHQSEDYGILRSEAQSTPESRQGRVVDRPNADLDRHTDDAWPRDQNVAALRTEATQARIDQEDANRNEDDGRAPRAHKKSWNGGSGGGRSGHR